MLTIFYLPFTINNSYFQPVHKNVNLREPRRSCRNFLPMFHAVPRTALTIVGLSCVYALALLDCIRVPTHDCRSPRQTTRLQRDTKYCATCEARLACKPTNGSMISAERRETILVIGSVTH